MRNPYYANSFWEFFLTLFQRIGSLLTGEEMSLASDELQLLILCSVAISCALVGSFLYLRKMTMLANALSHTILIGIVAAFWFSRGSDWGHAAALPIGAMLIASVVTGLFTTFLTQFFHRTVRLQEDASVGLVFTTLFALGIVLVTALTRSAHIGLEVVMGSVDALHIDDLKLVSLILVGNCFLFALFFKEYTITTFDSSLAYALGFSTVVFDYLLMTQVSATAVGAFRVVGVLMVLAFITAPVMTARLLTHSLKRMVLLAAGVGALASLIGVALSRHMLSVWGMPLSTGGVVVCVLVAIYGVVASWTVLKRV